MPVWHIQEGKETYNREKRPLQVAQLLPQQVAETQKCPLAWQRAHLAL